MKLREADEQMKAYGIGIAHMAMDMEAKCESSDLRRERNKEAILSFVSETAIAALYLHYLVPRISEGHSWMVDETVDRFGLGTRPVPSVQIFPDAPEPGNDMPAWRQEVPVPKCT
jgi:hypothetical protein